MILRNQLLVCCALFLLSGCALQRASEFASRYTNAAVINTVQIHHTDGVILTTYGRISGEEEHRVRQVYEIASVESEFVTVNLVADERAESVIQRIADEDPEVINRFHYALASSLRQSLISLGILENREVVVKLMVDELDSGKSFGHRARLDEVPLVISYILAIGEYPELDPSRPDWWSQAARGIAHELVHIKHGINRTGLDSVNEETAAELLGICAQVHFTKVLDVDAMFDLTDFLEHDVIRNAFPELEHGKFSPRLEYLDFMTGPSPQGRTIANAIAYLRSDDGMIYMNRPDSTDRLLHYCKEISIQVPDFRSGEL